MRTYEINVDCDKQKCGTCGKIKTGCYSTPQQPDKYICSECVLRNIKRLGRDVLKVSKKAKAL